MIHFISLIFWTANVLLMTPSLVQVAAGRRHTERSAEYMRCNTSYWKREFLPENDTREPALLLSHQGSGQTWVRLLIEYSYGIVTGSVYNDLKLMPILPGEDYCGRRQSAVRAHPDVCKIKPDGKKGFHITIHWKGYRRKCHRGQIWGFHRFAILLRDPYRAIWAEHQRQFTLGHHNTGIEVADFNQSNWEKDLIEKIAIDYAIQWPRMYRQIFKLWPKDFAIFQYEHLTNRSTRTATLRKLLDYLNVVPVSEDRLNCSFSLAENPVAHRSVDPKVMVTINQAYQSEEIVCAMWKIMLNMTDLALYGYKPWKNANCKFDSLDISDYMRNYKGEFTVDGTGPTGWR